MKMTVNEVEFDIRNPAGVEYIRSVFLATMKQRHKDDEKIEKIVQGLTKGYVPQRGARGGAQNSERTAILKGLLQSAGIEAELRSKEGKEAALSALAAHLNKSIEELEQDLESRAEKMREVMAV
jgi:predicted component of type VI protein secretion system